MRRAARQRPAPARRHPARLALARSPVRADVRAVTSATGPAPRYKSGGGRRAPLCCGAGRGGGRVRAWQRRSLLAASLFFSSLSLLLSLPLSLSSPLPPPFPPPAADMPRVYIGRLSYHVREKDIQRFFSGYGRLLEVDLKNG